MYSRFQSYEIEPSVFWNREHAGKVLSDMLLSFKNSDSTVFGIPAGGVPVAAPIASNLGLDLDVAVVSKITLPWNTSLAMVQLRLMVL